MPRRRRPRASRPPRPSPAWDAIYPTLDLHGETADSARLRAERWLRERQRDGEPTVRLITGRGLHSVGPPVLPGEIADLLRALQGDVVADSEREPGGGVVRVRLRPPPPSPRRSTGTPTARRRTDPADAALRREAEEALAELGIDATPELVEAEIRRRKR